MRKWSKRKIFKTIWFSLAIAFVVWNWTTFQSRGLPESTFEESDLVLVSETSDEIIFHSKNPAGVIEIIFFQGGLVDPKAYAPMFRSLAESGYTCHIIKMSWRLPVNDYQKVVDMFNLSEKNFVIGGHSQGAKMAAQLVFEKPDVFKGLFLMGTSHPRDIDLSNSKILCLKLYAENDGLASVEEVLENKRHLPKKTDLIMIEGGNHSQFGYIGKLFMDSTADISLETQQNESIRHIQYFLGKVNKGMSRSQM